MSLRLDYFGNCFSSAKPLFKFLVINSIVLRGVFPREGSLQGWENRARLVSGGRLWRRESFKGIPRDPSVDITVLLSSGIWPFSILDCDRIHITESFYLCHFKSPVPWHWWRSFLPATCLSFHLPVQGQTSFLFENWIWGHQVDSVGQRVCHQIWQPELGPCNPRGERREPTPSCSLLPSDRHRGAWAHTNT